MIRAPFAYAQVMMDAAGVPAALQAEPKTLAFYAAIATAIVASLHDAEVAFDSEPTGTLPRLTAVVTAGTMLIPYPPPPTGPGPLPAAGTAKLR